MLPRDAITPMDTGDKGMSAIGKLKSTRSALVHIVRQQGERRDLYPLLQKRLGIFE